MWGVYGKFFCVVNYRMFIWLGFLNRRFVRFIVYICRYVYVVIRARGVVCVYLCGWVCIEVFFIG